MKRWKSIPSKISVKDLESHQADQAIKEAAVVRTGLPPKYFIAHNTKLIKTIEKDTQENKRLDNKEK
jgi:hypothetical protein